MSAKHGARRASFVLLVLLRGASPIHAQNPTRPAMEQAPVVRASRTAGRASGNTTARAALDGWIVTRFHGVQLLEDAAATSRASLSSVGDSALAITAAVPAPRVESTREAASGDTVFALTFATTSTSATREPVLRPSSTVRVNAPGEAMGSHTATIIARRAFRAPRVPNADSQTEGAWRYGWAYIAVISRGRRPSPSIGYRGWILSMPADSSASTRVLSSTTRR